MGKFIQLKSVIILTCALVITSFFQAYSQCNTIQVSSVVTNVTPTSATINFVCCQTGTYYLEYGAVGFTPGIAGFAGAGGTLISIPSNQGSYILTGLTVQTSYDVYLRLHCGGSTWSANSSVISFSTAPDCANATPVTCNTFHTFNPNAGKGAWSFSCMNLQITHGKEKIYSFTPTFSGYATLFAQGTSSNTNIATFFYKQASGGCNSGGWNCIGPVYAFSGVNQYQFGPLTAGIQYYILADEYNTSTPVPVTFRIECGFCISASNVSAGNISPNSAIINWNWNVSSGILEYGPPGFIPGTGATPGTNGTIVSVSQNTKTLQGLNPGTGYDVYLRPFCNGNYGANSIRFTFYTPQCPINNVYSPVGTEYWIYSTQPGYYHAPCFMSSPGEESYFSFTPPASGYYTVKVNPNFATGAGYNFYTKSSAQVNCDVSTYTCMIPTSTVWTPAQIDYYTWGPLTAGTTYQFLFDASSITNTFDPDLTFSIYCPEPENIVANDIRPTRATFTWNCNCPSTTLLEYGPPGFTPGTGATAGTNGTVITNVASPYILNGLVPDTKYDVYLRVNCGGTFMENSPVIKIRTAQDCSQTPTLVCSDYAQYSVAATSLLPAGAWTATSACGNVDAREKLWKFTPTQTGTYSLLVYDMSANSFNYTYPISFHLRQSAGYLCNEQGWTCVGTVSQSMINFSPVSVSLGTLTGGTEYMIMADGVQPTFTQGYTYSFRLDCPNVCEYPKLLPANQISNTGATINMGCDSCFGNLILEYGPSGFTPGSGANAGAGGTTIPASVFPYVLTGLNSNTTYDVYARQNCGSGSFSINCPKISFITTGCNTAPVSVSSNAQGNTICKGTPVILTQNGGIPAAGGSIKWYTGSCGGTLVGTGNSITVSPGQTKTYYARAEANCGNSGCASINITVKPLPPAVISVSGSTSFCLGTSKLISANTGAGLSYQWLRNGVPISGATASTYNATKGGNYKCAVTLNGCTKNSNVIYLTRIPKPPATITANGPLSFCNGDSVRLSANAGTGYTYQWRKGGVNITGATGINYYAKLQGKYTCVVTNSQGCYKISNGLSVTVPCRSALTINKEIKIYPNPAQSDFTIMTGELIDPIITIHDLSGRIVEYGVEILSEVSRRINGLPQGVYFVEVSAMGERETFRIVILGN